MISYTNGGIADVTSCDIDDLGFVVWSVCMNVHYLQWILKGAESLIINIFVRPKRSWTA